MEEKNTYQNNQVKLNFLLDLWYKKTFGDNYSDSSSYNAFQKKINLASNDVVKALENPTDEDYLDIVNDKLTNPISNQIFKVGAKQDSLDLIFYCSTNYYDTSNPQKGISNGTYVKAIRDRFLRCNKRAAIKVIFGGDILGEEWQFKNFKDSTIKDNRGQFHGLMERKRRLIKDIKLHLNIANQLGLKDVEIYLIKGHQEHVIKKKLCIDVMEDVVKELKNPRVKYISEGVNPYIRCEKILRNGRVVHSDIRILTNMRNKGKTAKAEAMSVERYNGRNIGTTTFVLNGNVFGKMNHRTEYHVTGQSEFLKTTKGNKPDKAAKGYDVFSVYTSENDLSVVQEAGALFSPTVGLEMKEDYENKRIKAITKEITSKIDQKIISKFKNQTGRRS